MRVTIREEDRTAIYRFLSELSLEIRDTIEFLLYKDFNDLV